MTTVNADLNEAISQYRAARFGLAAINKTPFMHRSEAMANLNRSRARLKNVVKAANVLLGRCV